MGQCQGHASCAHATWHLCATLWLCCKDLSYIEFEVEKDENYALSEFLHTNEKSTVGTWNNESNITPHSNWKSWNSCGMEHIIERIATNPACCTTNTNCSPLLLLIGLPYAILPLSLSDGQPKSFPLKCDSHKKKKSKARAKANVKYLWML